MMPYSTLMEDPIQRAKVNEAVCALTQKDRLATTLERVRLFDEAHTQVCEMDSQPLAYGIALKYVLSRVSLPIDAHDLLLGRIAEEVPDAQGEAYFQQACARFGGRSVPPWIYDSGHISFYWKDAVALGLCGLRTRAEDALQRHRVAHADQERLDFLQGAIYVYEALQTYLLRYADAAEAQGLAEAAEVCRCAATEKPRSFRVALQMLWAIMLVYCALLAENATLTYGRMDLLLDALYESDLRSGTLTRDEAARLVLDFYGKNNLIMGRGEHQLSADDAELITGWKRNLNYDSPQYMLLGGEGACSDLTQLMAECIVPAFKNPVVVVRYGREMARKAPWLWRTLVEKMLGSASLMVYNEDNAIAAYINGGVDPVDAQTVEYYGCNWPCIPGMETVGMIWLHLWGKRTTPEELASLHEPEGFDNLPAALLDALDELARRKQPPASIDDVYEALGARFARMMRIRISNTIAARKVLLREAPGALHMQDCFFRDTIERAANAYCGGSKYAAVAYTLGGMATISDSLAAIEQLVFRERRITFARLHEALRHNFAGYEDERLLCMRAGKFGNDDIVADGHAHRLVTMLTDITYGLMREVKNAEFSRIIFRFSVETDTRHIEIGRSLGATPDGRLAGMPVSQNCQPSPGASEKGLTARLSSLARLPNDRIISGAQNMLLQRTSFSGEKGKAMLAAMLGTYFAMGGLQAQVSAVDTSELYDAQRNPDAHRDLMVRVTGYSAVFVDMNKTGQDDIIARNVEG